MKPTAEVVGAGVAGLAAAVKLARAGWHVDVYEQQPFAGGLLAPQIVDGVPCDLGAHRLHPAACQVPVIAELARSVALQARPRRGVLVMGDRHVAYPLRPAGLVRGLGIAAAARMAAGLAMAPRWRRAAALDHDAGFADFVIARVGREAARQFYLPYAQKVWGLDPAELSQSCAKQRLSSAAPWRLLGGGGQFLVPAGGFSRWIDSLRLRAEQLGAHLHLGRRRPPAGSPDAIVHTGHLSDLTPQLNLDHRGLYLLWLRVQGPPLPATDTWYCPGAALHFGRVTQVGCFADDPRAAAGLLCLEIPQGRWPAGIDWQTQLPELTAQLRRARILGPAHAVQWRAQQFVPRVYPLYRRGWRADWHNAVHLACEAGNVWVAGRQGLWLHCNIDHAMATADAAADHIVSGKASQSWPAQAKQYAEMVVRD